MSAIDIAGLLNEVSIDSPCGDDLEYDPAFIEIEQLSQGKPEQRIGDTVVPAQGPDWNEVSNKTRELFKRTKDLRLAVYLVQASVHQNGLLGLKDGLLLIKTMLEQYWDEVHPQLDAEDNDPILRVNTIAALCDSETILRGIRECVLASSNVFGRLTLRDIQYATGKAPVPAGMDKEVPDLAAIDATFMDSDVEVLQQTQAAVALAIETVASIESILMEKVGAEQAPDLAPLSQVLKEVSRILEVRSGRHGQDDISPSDNEDAAHVSSEIKPSDSPLNSVNSREDVVYLLERACDYYARCEPSSPVPLLLQRARRLVEKDFIEIMRDLAPTGLVQAEEITGVASDDASH